jgi:hypothetical protein
LAIWLWILGSGAVLLYLRYDWNIGGGFFAKRGYVLSLYLFVIMLPTVYYFSRWTLRNNRVAVGLTAITFVIFTLPYNLLGLDSLYYYRVRPQWFVPDLSLAPPPPEMQGIHFPAPTLQFLPGGLLRAFPFDWLFMPLLFAAGAACVWGAWWIRARAGFRARRMIPTLLTVAFAVICLQAFFHSGMRAPYTYLSYFQAPKSQHHWYVVYHFKDGSGATEGDQYTFAPLEDYFQGAPRLSRIENVGGFPFVLEYNGLIRRPFAAYVESQFSYFVNDFYGWLALNCLFWLAAVFATARVVGRLTNPRAGLIAGALTLFGSGFIAFVGTTSMYMANYAAAAIAVCAFEDLVVSPTDRGPRRYALFMGVMALCALVYDLEPLFVVLLAYGLARRVSWKPLVASLAVAFVLLEGFTFVVIHPLHIAVTPGNSQQLTTSLKQTWHLLTHPSLPRWYDTVVSVVPSFLRMWFQAFFLIPALLALLGMRYLRDRALRVLVGGLFVYGLVVIAVLQIGGQLIGTVPRLIYPTFIGVYLPAAVALDAISQRARTLGRGRGTGVLDRCRSIVRRLGVATPWIVVAVMAVLVNIDVFGYPTLYVEYFVSTPPYFLPG